MNDRRLAAMAPEGPPRAPGSPCVRPRLAASLVLVRDDGAAPRVLMGRRHSGHSFMPDRWVFPGGRLDRADHRTCDAGGLPRETHALLAAHLKPSVGAALARAAVRELWEETGLRLAAPELSGLQVIGRAITPPVIAKRFDAWFFMTLADRLVSLDRAADCGELDEIAWLTLDATRELKLPGVTRLMLDEALARLTGPDRPRPFLRWRAGEMRCDELAPHRRPPARDRLGPL